MKIGFILPFLLSGLGLAQSAGTFTATGSMITPRFGHTATLLQNGKVLIAGGYTICVSGSPQPCSGPNSAELYEPITGAFNVTGAMHTSRPIGGILLPNGKVLFAESFFTGALAKTELYDPAAGNFISSGTPATLRRVDSMTLLDDGRALLIGSSGTASAAEIYDAITESFSPAANWPQEFGFLTVLSVLPDGRVLLDYPALYDPVTGVFTKMPIWSLNDTPPAALLPDGRVLITGGNTDGGNVNWASLFDSATRTFIGTGSMSSVRDAHTANALPDGAVLIAGGGTTFNAATRSTLVTSSAEIYDPATGRFSVTGSMTVPRLSHAAVLLSNGQIFISGGQLSSPPEGPGGRVFAGSSSAELYTPAVLIPAPVLFSLSGDGKGQGAIWHAVTGQAASANSVAKAGETLSMYTTSLAEGGVIPPQIAVGGRLAEVLYFGASSYPGYNQVNFRVPNGVAPGPAVTVRLTYLNRPSNEVTIAVQ